MQANLKLKIANAARPGVIALFLCLPAVTQAQAGPPFLTNDPGTPGNANWEINLGSMQTIARGMSSYELPQIDLNFGLGNRVQLTFEVPYVLQAERGRAIQSGWGNAYPGVKWRFVDGGEQGWQLSVFPQIETAASQLAQQKGIATAGPRYLVPLEIAKKIGYLNFDFEAGAYIPAHGPKEHILGIVTGRPVTDRLELDAEIYDDHAYGAMPHSTTLDFGGRYEVTRGFIALFMAGGSLKGYSNGQPEFIGYLGGEILLSNYGRTISSEK